MKSAHVAFNISHSIKTTRTKRALHIHAFYTTNGIKKNKKVNLSKIFEFRTSRETSNVFFRERQWLVKAFVLPGYLAARVSPRGGPCTWIFPGFHPPRTAPIGFSVRPMLFNRSASEGCGVSTRVNFFNLRKKMSRLLNSKNYGMTWTIEISH